MGRDRQVLRFQDQNVDEFSRAGVIARSTTRAYKRHWGAYGKPPNDDKQAAYDPKAPVSQQFGNPVHCVKIANDGLVYVCDRTNNRIQVFKKDGSFVKEWFYEKNTLANGAVWDVVIWPDPKQTWLLSADGANNEIRVLKREDGTVAGSFGRNGRNAGQFHWPWRWMPRATSIPARSIPASGSRSSS